MKKERMPYGCPGAIRRCSGCSDGGCAGAGSSDAAKIKELERKLRESENRFREFVNDIHDGFFITNDKGVYTFANVALAKIIGYDTPEEIMGKHFREFLRPEEVKRVMEMFQDVLLSDDFDESIEIDIVRKDGDIRTVSVKPTSMVEQGQIVGAKGTVRDVTTRKQTESMLQENMEKYSTLVEGGNDGIVILQGGIVVFANKKMLEMSGLSEEEAFGKPFLDFVSEEDKLKTMEAYKKRMAGEDALNNYEIALVPKEGQELPVEINASTIPYGGKQADMAIIRDITPRKMAERELEKYREHLEELVEKRTAMLGESEGRLKKAQEIASLGNWEWNIDSGDIYLSDEVYRMFAIQPHEFGATYDAFFEVVHPEDREKVMAAVSESVENGVSYDMEHRIVKADGEIRFVREQGEVLRDDDGKPVKMIGVILDITAMKTAELLLREKDEFMEVATKAGQIGTFSFHPQTLKSIISESWNGVMGVPDDYEGTPVEYWMTHIHKDDEELMLGQLQKIISGEVEVVEEDFKFEHTSKGTIWLRGGARLVAYDSEGTPEEVIGYFQDITERKLVEEQLREKDEYMEIATSTGHLGIYFFNLQSGEAEMSDSMLDVIGLPEDQRQTPFDFWAKHIHPDDAERILRLQQKLADGEVDTLEDEFKFEHPLKGTIWLKLGGNIYSYSPDGRPLKSIGYFQDITERKLTEEQLREKDEFMELATKSGNIGTFIFNLQTRGAKMSDSMQDVIGFSKEQRLKPFDLFVELIHPDDTEIVRSINKNMSSGEIETYDVEVRFEHPSKGTIWLRVGASIHTYDSDGRPLEDIGYIQDITERKLAEEQLREKDEYMEIATSAGRLGTYSHNPQTKRSSISDSLFEVLGMPKDYEGTLFSYFEENLHPDYMEHILDINRAFLEGEIDAFDEEFKFEHPSKGPIWLRGGGRVISYTLGETPEEVIGYFQDITGRKMAEEQLAYSEELFRNVYNGSPSIILVFNEDTTIMDANQTAMVLFGKAKSELIGLHAGEVLNCIHYEDDDRGCGFGPSCHKCPVRSTMEFTLETGKPVYETESPFELMSGEERVFLTSSIPLGLRGENKVLMILHDITGRKKAENKLVESERKLRTQTNQLIQAEKMAGLGVMAAGVGHELNNPLMGILNFTQYCMKHTPEDSRTHPVLQDIVRESQRCADIVQGLIQFASIELEEKGTCDPIDLRKILDTVEQLFAHRMAQDGIEFNVDIPKEMPDFFMEATRLQQIITNLVTNSIDALEGEDEKRIIVSLQTYKGKARITVEDTGVGISRDKVNKIFDPFYTTKGPEGTGMGLSISHSIVASYGGDLTCESEEGVGTKFHIYLDKGGECDERTSIGDR